MSAIAAIQCDQCHTILALPGYTSIDSLRWIARGIGWRNEDHPEAAGITAVRDRCNACGYRHIAREALDEMEPGR